MNVLSFSSRNAREQERKNIRKKGVQKRWMHIMNKEKKKKLTKKGKRK